MYITTVRSFSGILTLSKSVTFTYGNRICSALNRSSLLNHQSTRNIFRVTERTEARLKLEDSIPKEYELIYRAPLLSYVKIAQAISSISIAGMIGIGLYRLSSFKALSFPMPVTINSDYIADTQADAATFAILVISFIAFNVGIFSITLRYPYRIYHNPVAKAYICVLKGILPSNMKKVSFKKGEILRRSTIMSVLLPWKDSIFKVERRTVFLVENGFRTPVDLSTMLSKL